MYIILVVELFISFIYPCSALALCLFSSLIKPLVPFRGFCAAFSMHTFALISFLKTVFDIIRNRSQRFWSMYGFVRKSIFCYIPYSFFEIKSDARADVFFPQMALKWTAHYCPSQQNASLRSKSDDETLNGIIEQKVMHSHSSLSLLYRLMLPFDGNWSDLWLGADSSHQDAACVW